MTQGAEETNGKWGPQAVERGGEDRRENWQGEKKS